MQARFAPYLRTLVKISYQRVFDFFKTSASRSSVERATDSPLHVRPRPPANPRSPGGRGRRSSSADARSWHDVGPKSRWTALVQGWWPCFRG